MGELLDVLFPVVGIDIETDRNVFGWLSWHLLGEQSQTIPHWINRGSGCVEITVNPLFERRRSDPFEARSSVYGRKTRLIQYSELGFKRIIVLEV
ncbi:hypothetical protein [Saliphagus sp. LR7]|uniref:hypothetical protein n=1 Tax=Saliphagus sp. LR7 TaxID=2282654 RepID=UPI001300521B|nr:hypothetical protein [Saliphagus sp. LR7]